VKLELGLHFSRNIILVMQTGPSVTSQNLVPRSEQGRLHVVIGSWASLLIQEDSCATPFSSTNCLVGVPLLIRTVGQLVVVAVLVGSVLKRMLNGQLASPVVLQASMPMIIPIGRRRGHAR